MRPSTMYRVKFEQVRRRFDATFDFIDMHKLYFWESPSRPQI
jgi:hypothetical protein